MCALTGCCSELQQLLKDCCSQLIYPFDLQAQHDVEAAELVCALRAAACIPLLTLPPARRTPQQVTLLTQLTKGLQVLNPKRASAICVPY